MKKRFLVALIALICAVACALSLAACGERPGGGGGNNPGGGNNVEYTVVFDANGGKFEKGDVELGEDVTFDDGTVISADGTKMMLTTKLTTLMSPLRNPERDRYALCGWALDKDGETMWDFDSDTLKGNITLYAVWSITFDYALSEDGSYYIVRGIGGLSGDVEVPETHNGKPVKAIAVEAFKNSRSLTGIVIPDSVTEIGARAFMNATKLESVKAGEGITYLPDEVLKDCKELAVLYLPKSLKEIKYTAFGDEGQDSLVEVHYAGTLDDWCTIEMDCSTDKEANPLAKGKAELFIDGEVVTEATFHTEKIGRWAFFGYKALKKVTIGKGVKEIETQAFCVSGVTTLAFADDATVTTIGRGAFSGSEIETLEFPDSLVTIGENAFYGSSKLVSVSLGGVKYVGASAFENCYALTTVDLGQAEELGDHAFASYEPEAKLTAVTIPDTVWYMGSGCFSEQSKLNGVTFASNENSASWQVTTVRGYNQETETLTSDALTAPAQNAKRIKENGVWIRIAGELTFSETNDGEEYTVTGVKNKNGRGALIIPEKHNDKPVTGIGGSAFADFAGLRSVSIPASVESIGDGWISGCKPTGISVAPTNAHYGSYNGIFYKKNGSILWVSSRIGTTRANGWVDIPYGVKTIPSKAFAGLNIWGVEIPDSVTSVSDSAFEGCPITMVTVPAFAISAIPKDKLETVVITSGDTIEENDFKDAKNLTSLVLPDDLDIIERNAFQNCYALSELTIPAGVRHIYPDAFHGCDGLTLYTSEEKKNCKWSYSGCPVVYGGSGGVANDGYMYVMIDGVRYALKDGEATVAKQPGGLTSVTVPASVKYKDEAYSVTKIAEGAFDKCENLVGITVSSKVDGYSSYGGILYNKDKTEIVCMPGGIRGTIVIPKSVTKIGASVFEGCDKLTAIEVEEGNPSYESRDGILYNKDMTKLICIPHGKTSVVIADGVKIDLSVLVKSTNLESISVGANPDNYTCENGILFNSDKTNIVLIPKAIKGNLVLPDSMTNIRPNEFSGCGGLTSVTIPDSVTSIGFDAFFGCSSLTSITIPDSVTSIGSGAFSGCGSLTSITIPDSVKSIGYEAFSDCGSLTSVTIGSGVTSIGQSAFSDCAELKTVYWNATACTSAGTWNASIFYNCNKLKTVIIGGNVTTIPDYAFRYCYSLTSVTIGDSVTSIGESAFEKCDSLTSITIPDSVTSIDFGAFYDCDSLTSVTIGSGVTSIGKDAFFGCYGLKSIYYTGDIGGWCGISGLDEVMEVHPIENPTLYIDGQKLTGALVIPDGVTIIGKYAFSYCSGLTGVTIPDSVTSIGERAFRGCSSLTSITIPDSVTSIGDGAFVSCSKLASITLPFVGASKDETGHGNFGYIFGGSNVHVVPTSLKTVVITGGNSIGSSAFEDCSRLTSITIPNSVTSIGNRAFYGCSSLTSITIPDGVTSIGRGAFSDCGKLESITIPDSVESIGISAFSDCSSLASITLPFVGANKNGIGYTHFGYIFGAVSTSDNPNYVPKSLKSVVITGGDSIGASAFYGCGSLTSMTLPFVGCSATADSEEAILGYIFGKKSYSGSTAVMQYFYNVKSDQMLGNTYFIPSSLKSVTVTGGEIVFGAFYGLSGLTSVTLSDGVTSIGKYAFYECYGLTSVTIPNSVTSIGKYAFSGCGSLKYNEYDNALYLGNSDNPYVMLRKAKNTDIASCQIHSNTRFIDQSAFSYCSSLTSITIPNGVTSIGEYAFRNCSSLTSITIPNSVTSIGSSAFDGCNKLTIYCEAESQPDEWENDWNSDRPVVWGYKNS